MSDDKEKSAAEDPQRGQGEENGNAKDEARATPDAATPESGASASWGYPAFAKDFPRHEELDVLVAAFANGDYATVRERAPKLAAATDDDAVKHAARILRERVDPDPTSKVLFLFAGALLAFLTAWWVAHDGPEAGASPQQKVIPKVEHID